MLATWLSYDDLDDARRAASSRPTSATPSSTACPPTATTWWDNSAAAHLGFRPQDSSEAFRAEVEAQPPRGPRPTRRRLPGRRLRERRARSRTATHVDEAAELVVDARCGVGESPVWRAARAGAVLGRHPGARAAPLDRPRAQCDTWTTPRDGWLHRPASTAAAAGRRHGERLFPLRRRKTARLAAEPRSRRSRIALRGMRFNDGRCDRQGRFWAGTMLRDMARGRAASAASIAIDAAAARAPLRRRPDRAQRPGASAPTAARCTCRDSHPERAARSGPSTTTPKPARPPNRRLFVDMNPLPGRPDGAAVDADGCYWICGNDAGLVHRFTPDGRLDRSLACR